jgi:hypothetical protein
MKDTIFGNVSLSVWQKYILEEFNASIFSRLCLLLAYLALAGSTPKTTCDITQTDMKKKLNRHGMILHDCNLCNAQVSQWKIISAVTAHLFPDIINYN